MKWLRKLYRKLHPPKYRFQEDVDFRIVPDMEAAKNNDPHPWNIYFLNRIIKVHSIRFPEGVSADGTVRVDIKAEVLYGGPLTKEDDQQFGDLCMELIKRNMLLRD